MRLTGLGAWLLVAGACAPAVAQDQAEERVEWSFSAGIDHSDNIRRASDLEDDESIGEAGLRLSVERDRSRYELAVDSDVRYVEYLDDTFDSEARGELFGELRLQFSPDRVSWVFRERYGQLLTDPRRTDTPDNRGDINYFETGPEIALPLGARTALQLQGRWADASYERGDADSRRYVGGLGVVRTLSPTVAMSLNGSTTRVEFDSSPTGSDYDVQVYSLGVDARGGRTDVSARVGHAALHDSGETNDTVLIDLSLTRRVGVRTELSLEAGRTFGDAATTLEFDQAFYGVSGDTNTATATIEPYLADYAYAGWRMQWARTSFELAGNWRDESYEDQPLLDRTLYGLRLAWSRDVTARASLDLWSAVRRDEFASAAATIEELEAGVGFGWNLSRQLAISLRLAHVTGNNGIGDVRDFDENRAYLGLVYSGSR